MTPYAFENGLTLYHGDALAVLRELPAGSCDLVLCSPPYEAARTYGIDFNLRGQDWVDWCVPRFLECCRVSRGLVCWVVEGQTSDFRWSATPALLMADLHRAGVKLRKPPIYHRIGIPGSGGPDWWRQDYEFCICAAPGKLPWSDNTANGHPPLWGPGGAMTNRMADGRRVNIRLGTSKNLKDSADQVPAIANAGNVVYGPPLEPNGSDFIHCNVGGGAMGSDLAHKNEAPFPMALVEPFIKCFCPPDGTVLDCFCGSGTTLDAARKLGRKSIGIDIRESQVELSKTRLAQGALF